jgi:chloramphenicol-sensitive protein RarD
VAAALSTSGLGVKRRSGGMNNTCGTTAMTGHRVSAATAATLPRRAATITPLMNPGIAYAALGFVLWGLFPLYFRQIVSVPPLEVVLHRSVWALVFVFGLLAVLRRFGWMRELASRPRQLGLFAISALLLSGNWLVYVFAVQTGHVVEASLGYFINPLVNVLLGVMVLHERLRRVQWAAVGLAALGVLWLTLQAGRLPWIALVLALSFGVYGLIRKTATLGALEGLALETLLLAPVVVPLLAWWTWTGNGAMARGDAALNGWLLLAGPLTVAPLLLFAAGARRLPLATVGLLQYISPTIQLALGIWVFGEPFDRTRLVGFVLIWSALAVVSVDGWRRARAS